MSYCLNVFQMFARTYRLFILFLLIKIFSLIKFWIDLWLWLWLALREFLHIIPLSLRIIKHPLILRKLWKFLIGKILRTTSVEIRSISSDIKMIGIRIHIRIRIRILKLIFLIRWIEGKFIGRTSLRIVTIPTFFSVGTSSSSFNVLAKYLFVLNHY